MDIKLIGLCYFSFINYSSKLPPVQKSRTELDATGDQTSISLQSTLTEMGEYQGNLIRDLSYLDAEIERLQ
jgi:hypothetical protein